MESNATNTTNTNATTTNTESTVVTNSTEGQVETTSTSTETLTMEQVQKMIQSEADKVRTEYVKKLKAEEEAKKALERKLMTKEERDAADAEAKEVKFREMEAELNKTRMEIKTVDLLKANELPLDFKDFLIGTSEEVTVNKVNAFKKIWQEQIKAAVEGKFKENGRTVTQNNLSSTITKESFLKMSYAERNKLFHENPELYKQLSKL